VEVDKILLKLLIAACDAERYETALDAARNLNNEASFHVAITIANRAKLASFAPRVQAIMESKFPHDEDEEEEEEEVIKQQEEEEEQVEEEEEEVEVEEPPTQTKGVKRSYESMGRNKLRFSTEAQSSAKISPEMRRSSYQKPTVSEDGVAVVVVVAVGGLVYVSRIVEYVYGLLMVCIF
jgi:hypothetical protein